MGPLRRALLNYFEDLFISASLHRAKRYWYRTLVPPICRSSHVSSGDIGDRIRMPFGVVSGFGLGMGVWDFGGDCRRGRDSLGVNTMQKWRIDQLSTREKLTTFPYAECIAEFCEELAFSLCSQVQDRIGVEEKFMCKSTQKRNKTNATWRYPRAANSYGQAVICCVTAYSRIRTHTPSRRVEPNLTRLDSFWMATTC